MLVEWRQVSPHSTPKHPKKTKYFSKHVDDDIIKEKFSNFFDFWLDSSFINKLD